MTAKISNTVRALVWASLIAAVAAPAAYTHGECPHTLACRLLGATLLALVLRASAVTGRYLAVYGKSSPDKGFGDIDRLVEAGPYSCMRHPMHFFQAWLPLSVALLAASPEAVMVALPEAILVMVLAVTVDEKESIARFGEAYIEYRRRVPAFNPSPRCIAKALGPRPPRRIRKG